jgi:hypothetical protein
MMTGDHINIGRRTLQAEGLNHSSRGQRPRKNQPGFFRPERAIQKTETVGDPHY